MQVYNKSRHPVKAWVADLADIEPQAMRQLHNTASLPFIFRHVAVMPDVHFGLGAAIGTVIASDQAVIPSAVGVDIGCGILAARTALHAGDLPSSLAELRGEIERAIPLGFQSHREAVLPDYSFKEVACKGQLKGEIFQRGALQLGTLGGGNHFIEVCLDEEERVWIMLHSGSRHIGYAVAAVYIKEAKRLTKQARVALPDANLAYIDRNHELFDRYINDASFCQDYARRNRLLMLEQVHRIMERLLGRRLRLSSQVQCHHNYISRERHFGRDVYVTRKGAVRARKGELGIIPGSMGTRSYIVRGKGHPASFHSCAHGAGRTMSRKAARRRFTTADLARQTEGVECRKDRGVLDEIPQAYKDIDQVMANQQELVEVVHTLRQVLCVKG